MSLQNLTELLTASDLTKVLRVDRSTVYRMAEDGRLPGFKVGRQWRFRAHDLMEAMGASAGPTAVAGSLDVERSSSLIRLFADLYDVMVVITDLHGRLLSDVVNRSEYFELLSADPSVIATCTAEWSQYADDHEFVPGFRESHVGLLCARAFIRNGHELGAMVVVGGVAPDGWPDDERIARLAERHDLDADRLADAATAIPQAHAERRDDILSGLTLLARHLSPTAPFEGARSS